MIKFNLKKNYLCKGKYTISLKISNGFYLLHTHTSFEGLPILGQYLIESECTFVGHARTRIMEDEDPGSGPPFSGKFKIIKLTW